jgi:hypothetical protein
MCALLYLAYRRGVLVKLESDRLPEGLVTEAIPDNERRLDIDVSELEFSSPVGLFELERGDDGSPIILGRIYHPGHEPVSADDVPERAVGTVLSDEWIEAALDEAEWRSHYDTDLVSEARTAHEEGKLRRKLVVVQDRTDEYTFDETLAKVSVDEIEILKGAGKK